MGRLISLATLIVLAAGCGGASSTRLVDGSRPPPLPEALAGRVPGAVMTRVNATSASQIDPVRLQRCQDWYMTLHPGTSVVERTGVSGLSLTFANASDRSVYSCDSISEPFPDRDRPKGSPWCGGSVGRTVRGRLTDPRLGLCTNKDSVRTAFAWIEPVQGARWIVVREGSQREVYATAGSLPVRVTTTTGIQIDNAVFDVEQYAADGRRIRAYKLRAAVAG